MICGEKNSEKSAEFLMEIETTTFESQNRFHRKLYLKMLSNLVKKSTQWNSNSKVHKFVPVRHVYDNFPYRKNISNFGISAKGSFLSVFQSFQVSFSLTVILLYTTICERVENEVILG